MKLVLMVTFSITVLAMLDELNAPPNCFQCVCNCARSVQKCMHKTVIPSETEYCT